MPTKRRRHAITETPPLQEALDALRTELDGQRLDLSELVILGAREKLAHVHAERGREARIQAAEEIEGMSGGRYLPPDELDHVVEEEAVEDPARLHGPAAQ
jgi:hypothetical protein